MKFDVNELVSLGTFDSKTDAIKFIIMSIMNESGKPLGSGALRTLLINQGVSVSTATVGRYLFELDNVGITELLGNKGRIISAKGKDEFSKLEKRVVRYSIHSGVKEAAEVTDYGQLIKLYKVRKALEVEAITECINDLNDSYIDKMQETIDDYYDKINKGEDFLEPSLNFHVLLVESSRNDFLIAVIKMLIFEQMDIEKKLDFLDTREHGKQYAKSHEKILEALKRRDRNKAVALLSAHLEDTMAALSK